MTTWITITPRLQQGLKVVNQIDNVKFRLLVSRICQSLQSINGTKAFSEEEEEKLILSLEVNKEELTFLLEAVMHVYTQAACNIVKPSLLEAVLKNNLNVEDEKTTIFSNAWVTYGKGIIDCFKKKSIFPTQVKDINWCLNIQSSSSMIAKDARPIVLLQLDLTGEKNTKLTTEFDRKSLVDLYSNLEKIQKQLDALK